MRGTGTQMVVSLENYNAIEKAFLKDKGIQIALSPSEIEANTVVEGSGIFGKKFDKVLKKAGVKKLAYSVGSVVKPMVQEGIKAAEAMAVAYGVPPSIAKKIGDTAEQYVEDPKSLQGKKGLRELKKRGISLGQEVADMGTSEMGMDSIDIADIVKKATSKKPAGAPTFNMRAQGEDAVLSKLQQMVDARRTKSAPVSTDLYEQMDQDGIIGNGIMKKRMGAIAMMKDCAACPTCSGSGLYAGAASGRGMPGMTPARNISKKFVNLSRKLMGGELQALESQAMDANFAFRNTLPPAYQR
jgi:hypothetical protein